MKRRRRAGFLPPSLVPLADALTNTVGIIIFILIFTVLTAGAVIVAKRLPFERLTSADPINVFCAGNRIIPVPEDLSDKFLEPFERSVNAANIGSWVQRFNARRVETDDFLVRGEASRQPFRATIYIVPKPEHGETSTEARVATSRYRAFLGSVDRSKQFVHLVVRPDSIGAFQVARDMAIEAGLGFGWWPLDVSAPIGLSLAGGGRKPVTE
jgi:hypothetical protein